MAFSFPHLPKTGRRSSAFTFNDLYSVWTRNSIISLLHDQTNRKVPISGSIAKFEITIFHFESPQLAHQILNYKGKKSYTLIDNEDDNENRKMFIQERCKVPSIDDVDLVPCAK